MHTVNNKFEIGEECYSVYRKPTHYECPICNGIGVRTVVVLVSYIIQNSLCWQFARLE